MIHTIEIPDSSRGGEPASVLWDDEAGTVDGDHVEVPEIRRIVGAPAPVRLDRFTLIGAAWPVADPAHDPADFLAVLACMGRLLGRPGDAVLPPSLREVSPTPPGPSFELEPGAII